jgi:formate hydrogenlyase subunit 3/multisubunit Na+/H+ antiporter MnhD subunit
MNSPTIWILAPLVVAVLLYLTRRQQVLTAMLAVIVTLVLAILAWQLDIGEVTILGPLVFKIDPNLSVAGRSFVISSAEQPMLIWFFGILAFWFCGAMAVPVAPIFFSLGLGMGAVLIAAISVQPFLFAALFIEVAVLISVVALIHIGKPVNRGVMRYLSFQTIGMLFILVAGWVLGGIDARGESIDNIFRAAILLGFGFAFLLAVFPLHSWIPMLTEKANPYVAAFILSTMLSVVSIFALDFIERYPWLQDSLNIFGILRFIGAVTILIAGVWAAFERHLGRIIGFALMLDVGRILMTISLSHGGEVLNTGLSLTRVLSLGIWAMALTLINARTGNLRFRAVQGMARQFPIVSAGLIFAQLSFAGIPLLVGFPIYYILWEQLLGVGWWPVIISLLGSLGLIVATLRTLAVFVMGPEELPWHVEEKDNWLSQVFLLIGIAVLFLGGLFPQWLIFPFIETGFGTLLR